MSTAPISQNEIDGINYICNEMARNSFPFFWIRHRDEINSSFSELGNEAVSQSVLNSFLSRLNKYLSDNIQDDWDEFAIHLGRDKKQ